MGNTPHLPQRCCNLRLPKADSLFQQSKSSPPKSVPAAKPNRFPGATSSAQQLLAVHAHEALKKSSKEKPLLRRTVLQLKRGTLPSGGRRKQPRWPALSREDGCSTAARGPVRKHRPHAGNEAGPHHMLAPREPRGRKQLWVTSSPRDAMNPGDLKAPGSLPQDTMNSADTSSPKILSSPWDAMNRGIPEVPEPLVRLGCHEPWDPEAPDRLKPQGHQEPWGPQKPQITSAPGDHESQDP